MGTAGSKERLWRGALLFFVLVFCLLAFLSLSFAFFLSGGVNSRGVLGNREGPIK